MKQDEHYLKKELYTLIKEEESIFKFLQEGSLDGLWYWDLENSENEWMNSRFWELFGYDPLEKKHLVSEWQDLIFAEDLKVAVDNFNKHCSDPQHPYDQVVRYRHKNGSTVWVRCRGIAIRDKTGKPVRMLGAHTDLTKQNQAEAALKKGQKELEKKVRDRTADLLITNEKLEQELQRRKQIESELRLNERILNKAQEIAHVGSWHLDIKKNVLSWSNEMYRIFGLTPQEFGATYEAFLESVHPGDRERVDRIYTDSVKNKIPYECVHRVVRPDGTERIVIEKSENIVDEAGETIHSFGITHDITEQKQEQENRLKLEQQLQRAKKMESIGLLAGGVAHDLNNILSGIVSYPELLLMGNDLSSKHRKAIELILTSGKKAATIVADLLTVARGVATEKQILNLNNKVSEYINSPEHQKLIQYHPDITIKTILDPELLNIKGSPVHIDKIVLNLVSNAAEAIENDGNITISTMNRYLDRSVRGYEKVDTGEYVLLSISDDGPGIPEKDFERIFEPFYSKKVLGRSGTGLGMTVVWNSVQDHNGHIDIESTESGSTINVYLPITRDEEIIEKLEPSINELSGNGQIILIVDDEESQRVIASDMAVKLGYKVHGVASGEEAIAYLQDHKVDLVLLDMIMDPFINGLETYEKIIQIQPHQKAIIASGFSETLEVKEALKLGVGQYIQKPYSFHRLAKAMKNELER